MLEQVEEAYDSVFAKTEADEKFFTETALAFNNFTRRTMKRPISPRDVKMAQKIFRDQCRKAMSDAKQRSAEAN